MERRNWLSLIPTYLNRISSPSNSAVTVFYKVCVVCKYFFRAKEQFALVLEYALVSSLVGLNLDISGFLFFSVLYY